ncbi:MAG: response regulator [Phycisphaerae bacterium]|jgi:CheY-like chemotaxis protein|nr:response regulator [Phycisphaerae bacterium]
MKRILVCDDEPHIVEGLRYLLRSPDRAIVVARSGREALASITQQRPDLLILDIMMPQMSGLEVVAELRASDETRNLPIIILTAKGEARDASMAQEVWHAAVMAKPFEPKKLRELVTQCLGAN